MPQLHLYVPEKIARKVRQKAQQSGLSASRYLAELVKRDVAIGWPESFFIEVVGGWQGEPLTRPSQGEFDLRESWVMSAEGE
ncbi:MAG: hypothetical protein ACE5FD_16170 [Anaerolineae bacterium]